MNTNLAVISPNNWKLSQEVEKEIYIMGGQAAEHDLNQLLPTLTSTTISSQPNNALIFSIISSQIALDLRRDLLNNIIPKHSPKLTTFPIVPKGINSGLAKFTFNPITSIHDINSTTIKMTMPHDITTQGKHQPHLGYI